MTELWVKFREGCAEKYKKNYDILTYFSYSQEYLVTSVHSYSETSESQIAIVNDLGELWFVSNRDVTVVDKDKFIKSLS